ncbi:MAG: hypothetical protein M1823_002463 [Watsoniomyces obsoletus]|nr:MAG: hypothetical protein M1823_002463 [Watsoniomyces obsoletus]
MAAPSRTDSSNGTETRTQQSPLASQRPKEGSGQPTKDARANRFTQYFPLSYKDGFSQWWANISPAAAEHAVLSYVPYLRRPPTHTHTGLVPPSDDDQAMSVSEGSMHDAEPVTTHSNNDPHGPRTWYSKMIKLGGKDRALNEFSVERVGEDAEDHLVILHGYGAGLGYFYKNFEGLSRHRGWKLWALDLLGMGRSSRPPFILRAKDQQGKITEAENWFIDALEEWRIQRRLERFTLLGHSLGGYLAVAYALKYPGHLNKIILASPVGIPEDPYAVQAEMPEPETSTLGNEFLQDQSDVVNKKNPNIPDAAKTGDNNNFLNARSKTEKELANGSNKDPRTPTAPRRPFPKWLAYLWDANISPFSIVRWSGPLGPRFVSGWTSRRFSHLPPDEAQALHNYSYSLFRLRGSGEYALGCILAPGAFARSPLIRRIQGVGRQMITPSPTPMPDEAKDTPPAPEPRRENGVPVVFMYGENDWMDVAGGYAAEQKMKEERELVLRNATEAERKADNGSGKVIIIRRAGHHVYLDGWEEFNEVVRKEMEDVTRRRKAMEGG